MWPPTGLIPWFSKTDGNTYATLLHHPFLFKGKPTHAQEVARRISGIIAGEVYAKSSQDLISRHVRISGAVAGEIYAQVKIYQVPITNSYPLHYIICHLPLIFLSPTSKTIFVNLCLLFTPLLFDVLFVCVPCPFFLLASSLAKSLWILIHLLMFLRDPIMMNQFLVI